MKSLLENEFLRYFNLVRNVSVVCHVFNSNIELRDEKACEEKKCIKECDRVVAKIHHANKEIVCIDIENFFNQLVGTKADCKEKCDLLMYDEYEKVVLCELTCSKNEYINPYENAKGLQIGKRNKAKDQLKSIVIKLCEVPEINEKLLKYQIKSAVFAYRLPDLMLDSPNKAIASMSRFIQTPMHKRLRGEEIANGFVFEQVQYPAEYYW